MSNSEMSPKPIELLASLKPYETHPWFPSNQGGSSDPWKISVGEFYGCVCHRPFDEPAPSPEGSNPANGLQLTEQAQENRPGLLACV